MRLRVEGYFCSDAKDYPDLDRAVLPSQFRLSCRVFDVKSLHITSVEKIHGSFFNPTYVVGVVDTEGSLTPFFIKRQKVQALQELINTHRDQSEHIL